MCTITGKSGIIDHTEDEALWLVQLQEEAKPNRNKTTDTYDAEEQWKIVSTMPMSPDAAYDVEPVVRN